MQIQADIRISDLLALLKTEQIPFYLCHHIAWMVKEQLGAGYEEYQTKHNAEWGHGCNPQVVNSGPYFYVYDNSKGEMSRQVMAQINTWVEKFYPDCFISPDLISGNALDTIMYGVASVYTIPLNQWERQARIRLLEKILEVNPDESIAINFTMME
jgi:hypothetical protein